MGRRQRALKREKGQALTATGRRQGLSADESTEATKVAVVLRRASKTGCDDRQPARLLTEPTGDSVESSSGHWFLVTTFSTALA